ncbi:MAG: hypothetical protein M1820_003057 [Bogoriella megaspora]|nr:MAG: hypothetical protein M1820_003057 [Bogoriella megaspora]
MSYYHQPPPPQPPPHGVQYNYAQGSAAQRPPHPPVPPPYFMVSGQQTAHGQQPSGAFYQNQNLPPIPPHALGQNPQQYQHILNQFQNGALPPPPPLFAHPPNPHYPYSYPPPGYPPMPPQQPRPVQQPPAVSLPQGYGYSQGPPPPTPTAFAPNYTYPRTQQVQQQHPLQNLQPSPVAQQVASDGNEGAANHVASHAEVHSASEESNEYRPDFSSILLPLDTSTAASASHSHLQTAVSSNVPAPALQTTVDENADAYSPPAPSSNMGNHHSVPKPASDRAPSPEAASNDLQGSHLMHDATASPRDATDKGGPSTSHDRERSFAARKEESKSFLTLLHNQNIRLQQLEIEGLDVNRLKELYAELGIADVDASVNSEERQLKEPLSSLREHRERVDRPASATSESIRTNAVRDTDGSHQPNQRSESISRKNENEMLQPKSILLAEQPQDRLASTSSVPTTNAAVTPSKPVTSAVLPIKPVAAANTSLNDKPTAAPSSRAEYIARLKAARAGKAAESGKVPDAKKTASPTTTEHGDNQKPAEAVPSVAPTSISTPVEPVPSAVALSPTGKAKPSASHAAHTEADPEAAAAAAQKKREAQTALARLKIEALRTKAAQEPTPSTPSGIPGLTLASSPPSTSTQPKQLTTGELLTGLVSAPAEIKTRKRPVASDFDEAAPSPIAKKPFGQARNDENQEPIIIEASDDEQEDGEIAIPGENKATGTSLAISSSAQSRKLAMRDEGLSDFPLRPNMSRQSTGAPSPALGTPLPVSSTGAVTPGSSGTISDLNKHNAELLLLKKKIALIEQRKKLQKADSSRPQSPNKVPQRPVDTLASSSPIVQLAPSSDVQPLSPTASILPNPLGPQNIGSEVNPFPGIMNHQALATTEPEATVAPEIVVASPSFSPKVVVRSSSASSSVPRELESKRRAEIQSRLSTFDAAKEAKRARREQLRREMEELEREEEREEQEKAALAAELESLGIDTEGMPKEEMQAKKEEIVQQQEDRRLATEHDIIEPPIEHLDPEAAEISASILSPAQNDFAKHDSGDAEVSALSPGTVNTAGPTDIPPEDTARSGDITMEEGELSDGGAPLPSMTVSHTNTMNAIPPEQEAVDLVNLANDGMTATIISSPASSTDVSMGAASSADSGEIVEQASQPETATAVVGVEIPSTTVSAAVDNTATNDTISRKRVIQEAIEWPDKYVRDADDDSTQVNVHHATEGSVLSDPVPTLSTTANLNGSAMPSEDESDLYSPSSIGPGPIDTAIRPDNGHEEVQASVFDPALLDVIEIDDDDDDDLYEPIEHPSVSVPLQTVVLDQPNVEYALKLSAEEMEEMMSDEMDIDDSSAASEDDVPEPKQTADDLATELQPTSEPSVAAESLAKEEQNAEKPFEESIVDKYTSYESPLRSFRAFRFHPEYLRTVAGGFRSITYAHRIDTQKQICRFEGAGGSCNDPQCEYQHFKDMKLSDSDLLLQIGLMGPSDSDDDRTRWQAGLRQIIDRLRSQQIGDPEQVARQIAEFRRTFRGENRSFLDI